MEIAQLSASEKSAVAEHAGSLATPETPEASFKEFATRVVGHHKAEAKENPQSNDAKHFDLSKAKLDSPEYREWAESGKVTLKAEPKKESAEPEVKAETKAGTKEGEVDARASIEPRLQEISERAWTQNLEGKDRDDFVAHLDKQAQSGVDFIAKHANRQQIESGLKQLFTGLPDAEARYRDFTLALAETKIPGELLAHVGLTKNDREAFRMVQDRQNMRWAVHGLALELLTKAGSEKPAEQVEERRPRAPKPPTIIGGRGAPPERADLAAARAGDFKSFDAAMRAKYASR